MFELPPIDENLKLTDRDFILSPTAEMYSRLIASADSYGRIAMLAQALIFASTDRADDESCVYSPTPGGCT
jgi:hypothetical protein